jgi:ABC-2 type transport system ATP-binding protein
MPVHTAPIVVETLSKTYPKASDPAVDGISFTLAPGQILGLLGPNAAGKSTTIRMIAGLILPTSGQVHVFGYDPVRQGRSVRERIGLGGEGERSFYYRLTGWQNLEFFGGLAGLRGRQLKDAITQALETFGLTQAGHQSFMKYSTGMKKRLALARAHLHRPPLYILDEPTSSVDPASGVEIRQLIKTLAQDGKSILIATHNMAEAEQLCDAVAIMHRGKIVACGPPGELRILFGDRPRTITIQLPCGQSSAAPAMEQFVRALSRIPEVTGLSRQNGSVRFQVPASTELTPIVWALGATGMPVHQFLVEENSLEDILIRLTRDPG